MPDSGNLTLCRGTLGPEGPGSLSSPGSPGLSKCAIYAEGPLVPRVPAVPAFRNPTGGPGGGPGPAVPVYPTRADLREGPLRSGLSLYGTGGTTETRPVPGRLSRSRPSATGGTDHIVVCSCSRHI
jgi:hypothetical protein